MDDGLGPIDIDILINNPALLASLAQGEEAFQKAVAGMQADANKLGDAVSKLKASGGFSDSVAEVAAYNDSLGDLAVGASVVEKLKVELADLQFEQQRLAASFDAGSISQEAYTAASTDNAVQQLALGYEIQRVNQNFEQGVVIQRESVAATEAVVAATEQEIGLLENLKVVLSQLNAQKFKITDVEGLARQNALIQEAEAEMKRFNNVGKVGFDEQGNAIKRATAAVDPFGKAIARATNLSAIGARVVTQLTRQIIGLGVGFLSFALGAKAIELIVEWVKSLDYFSGRLDQAKHNLEAFNEVQRAANQETGKEIITLKLLYQTATDVNNSISDRTKAAQELKKEFPEAFSNAKISAILNGQEKKSYDELTASIYDNAKAKAALDKIAKIESQVEDAEFQKFKINNARQAELGRISGPVSSSAGTGSGSTTTEAQQRNNVNVRADAAIKAQDEALKILKGQQDFLIGYAGGAKKLAAVIENTNKLIQEPLKNFDSIIAAASDKADLDNLKKALQAKLNALAPDDAQIAIYQDKIRKVEEIEKQYAPKTSDGKADANADAQSLKAKMALISQIAQANEAFTRKQLSADDAAIKAITDKFDALRAKIAAFNADPKNKNHQVGADVINALQPAEDAAVGNQINLNQTQALEQDIDKRKQMYADYEAYRLKVGSTIADAEYAELLQSGKDYTTYLQNIQKQYIDPNSNSAANAEKTKFVQNKIDENNEAQKKAFEDLLIATATYAEKRANIIAAGLDAEKKLTDAGHADRAAQVAKDTQTQLTQLDDANIQTLDAFKQLYDGLHTISVKKSQEDTAFLLTYIEQQKTAGAITEEAYLKYKKMFTQTIEQLKSVNADKWIEIGNAFNSLSGDLSGINSGLSSMVGSAGAALVAVGNISKLQDKITAERKKGESTYSDEVSMYGQIATSVISIIGSITSAAKQRKEAEQAYLDSVTQEQNAYNLSLNEEIRLKEQLNQNAFYKDYKADILDASLAVVDANTKLEASFVKLQTAQIKTGTKNAVDGNAVLKDAGAGATAGAAIGAIVGVGVLSAPAAAIGAIIGGAAGAIVGLFASKKKVDVFGPLLGVYPDLIQKDKDGINQLNEARAKSLLTSGLLTAQAKIELQNTLDLNEARKAAVDQINSDITSLAGSLGDDLRNALVDAFERGQSAADAFEKKVSDVIGNIVSQFLFNDIFGSEFDKLQANLKDSFGIGGDQNATDDLTSFYKDASPLVKQYQDALQAVKDAAKKEGLNVFGNPDTTTASSSLSGEIKGITADQANILEGSIHGMQLAIVEQTAILAPMGKTMQDQLAEMRSQTLVQLQIQVNTKRTADNTDLMRDSLKNIDNNTSSTSLINVLRAAGK